MNRIYTEEAARRLRAFLEKNKQSIEFETLTPDASTREYFRVRWNNRTAIACVYAEQFKTAEHTFLDVTELFLRNDLPVAEIYEFDENSGIVIQEDFGDSILRDFLHKSDDETRDRLLNESINLIARIQAATNDAYGTNSIASRLKFDAEKLVWELNFFKTHYFATFRQIKLADDEDAALTREFAELAKALESKAAVLCHRDFHAANLMLDRENRLRIIDHQDARIGTASYDLVSLLLDRVVEIPKDEWLDEKKQLLLETRERLGLDFIDKTSFDAEFDLQTVQRGLKAVGTFSYQSVNRGKTYFVPFIKPMLQIVLLAAHRLNRFPTLQSIIEPEI